MIDLQRVRNQLAKLSQGPSDAEEAEVLVTEKEKEIQALSEALAGKKTSRKEANETEIRTRQALEGLGEERSPERGHSALNDRSVR